MKTKYVVIRFDKYSKDRFAFRIYSRRHSDPKTMLAYKKELMQKPQYDHDCYEWYVMTEENARAEQSKYLAWLKANEQKMVEQALRKYWFNDLTDRKVAKDLMENR